MGESEERHIGDELRRVRKVCRLIRSCSFAAMVILLAFWAIVIIGSIVEQVFFGRVCGEYSSVYGRICSIHYLDSLEFDDALSGGSQGESAVFSSAS